MNDKGAGFEYESSPVGYYDNVFRRRKGIQSRWHHEKFVRISAEVGPGRLLDIGCGPGTFIGTLDSSINATGIDISSRQIDYARSNNRSADREFKLVGNPPFDFTGGVFDTVTLIELIEHLPYEQALTMLKEAHRVLKPGGRVVVSTPDYAGLWPILEALVNRLGDVDYTEQHITRFNSKKLSGLITEAGFTLRRIGKYQFLTPFTAFLGWRVADFFSRVEPDWIEARFGFLLCAIAEKK